MLVDAIQATNLTSSLRPIISITQIQISGIIRGKNNDGMGSQNLHWKVDGRKLPTKLLMLNK